MTANLSKKRKKRQDYHHIYAERNQNAAISFPLYEIKENGKQESNIGVTWQALGNLL